MAKLKMKSIYKSFNKTTLLLAALLTIVWTGYELASERLPFSELITLAETDRLLDRHESYVSNGNIEEMLSQLHRNFILEVLHKTGYSESFDKSQIAKHLELLQRIMSLDLKTLSRQVTLVDDTHALVSVVFEQRYVVKGSSVPYDEIVYQSMLIVKDQGELKIRKVLSAAA